MSASATPAMRQYLDAKQQHRDAILLFRMGDFYEMFYEDALVAARTLELTLTSRSKDANGGGIPMCGVPFHAVDGYIARLVKKGFRVAICDQVEDPRKAKGIVKREVVRVVSPGTLTDANYLDAREPAFLMSVASAAKRRAATVRRLAWRCSTSPRASSRAAEYVGADGLQALADELAVLRPREILVAASEARGSSNGGDHDRRAGAGRRLGPADDDGRMPGPSISNPRGGRCSISCAPAGSKGFGLDRHPAAVRAAGALVHYLRGTQKVDLAHVRAIAYRQRADALLHRSDDAQASRNRRGRRGRTRRVAARRTRSDGHVDRQSRLLRAWLLRPLVVARADSRSPRRRRGARVSHHRARQVPRRHQGRPGSRAARRARRARHGRTARPGRPEAVARRGSPRRARSSASSRRRWCARSCRSSTTCRTCAG